MAPGLWQIVVIVLLVMLVFGAGRIPRVMGDLAEGIKSFKKGMREEESPEARKTLSQKDDQAE